VRSNQYAILNKTTMRARMSPAQSTGDHASLPPKSVWHPRVSCIESAGKRAAVPNQVPLNQSRGNSARIDHWQLRGEDRITDKREGYPGYATGILPPRWKGIG
jgi:hypothetical protein